MDKKIIAVDFDGTLSKGRWPDVGVPNFLLIEKLLQLQQDGHKLILWTCREGQYLDAARAFLNENGIDMDGYNFSPYQLQSRKIVADIYIDDKNVFMVDDVDWHKIEKYIFSISSIQNKETKIKEY